MVADRPPHFRIRNPEATGNFRPLRRDVVLEETEQYNAVIVESLK